MVKLFLYLSSEQILFKLAISHSIFNRFSILTNDSLKSMGRVRIQQFLEDNTWS